MLSKNLFRFSPNSYLSPNLFKPCVFRNFSNKEHEALTRIFQKHESNTPAPKTIEEKAKNYQTIFMGANPQAILEKRRMHHEYLSIQKEKKRALAQSYVTPGDMIVDFVLYMEHNDHTSQLIDSILNYHQVAYQKNDNIMHLDTFKVVNRKKIPNLQFPVLKVMLGLESDLFLVGYTDIVNYLVDSNFIFDPRRSYHTAFSEQSIEFINKSVKPNLDMLFWGPMLTFQNLFKSSLKNFRGNRNERLVKTLYLLIKNVTVNILKNYLQIIKNNNQYKQSRQLVLDNFEEWVVRLRGNQFHGGENPDDADFEMYAAILTKYNSRSFRNFIEYKGPDKLYRWFLRMQMRCAYDPNRVNYIE